jgi:CubicO group peptidase (beta-lactamase class C family)
LASTSKTTTAAAVALLVDDHNYPDVQWTTPVSKLLPDDFILPNPHLTADVTIEDILSHRTGIATHDDSYFSVRAKNPDNAKSITRNLRNLEFVKPLRTTHIYSNIMFTVATHLVETVSGMSYTELIKRHLWKPLDMTNTFHDVPDVLANNDTEKRTTPYHWDKKTMSYVTLPYYPPAPEGHGAGCIFSSAGDYAKWIRALIQRNPILSSSAYKELETPRSFDLREEKWDIPFKSTELYTLGLSRTTYRGHTVIGHNGSVPGFRAVICYMPEFDWGLVIFGNSDTAFYVNEMLKYILIDEVVGTRKEDRVDWEKFFAKWQVREEAEDSEKPEWTKVEKMEPLGIDLEKLAGRYHNVGYKGVVLEMEDGKLVADCSDRCFPFKLTFKHLTGSPFSIEMRGLWDNVVYQECKGEVRVEGGEAVAVGLGLEEDVEGGLIWFDRVE